MKDDKLYFTHILECIDTIEEYTTGGKDVFFATKMIQDAVMRNLEIIGEATKKISKGLNNQYTEIPWLEMAGMRDVLIHEYFGVDLKIVWNVIEFELPEIKVKMKNLQHEVMK